MIPSLVVSEIRSALVEFLATTFSLSDDDARDELTQFLNDRDDGIFRGPYLRVRTPFRAVDAGWQSPLGWLPDEFTLYLHQAAAFDRLSSTDQRERLPTLVGGGHHRNRVGQDRVFRTRCSTIAPANAASANQASRR